MKKLSQKLSGGAKNEEAVMLRAFKYFDLSGEGSVDPAEFAKAVEKMGVLIPTQKVRDKIFISPQLRTEQFRIYKPFSVFMIWMAQAELTIKSSQQLLWVTTRSKVASL